MVAKLGHRQAVAEVLNNLGTLYQESGEVARARACHRRALALARAVRSPLEQARALEGDSPVRSGGGGGCRRHGRAERGAQDL